MLKNEFKKKMKEIYKRVEQAQTDALAASGEYNDREDYEEPENEAGITPTQMLEIRFMDLLDEIESASNW